MERWREENSPSNFKRQTHRPLSVCVPATLHLCTAFNLCICCIYLRLCIFGQRCAAPDGLPASQHHQRLSLSCRLLARRPGEPLARRAGSEAHVSIRPSPQAARATRDGEGRCEWTTPASRDDREREEGWCCAVPLLCCYYTYLPAAGMMCCTGAVARDQQNPSPTHEAHGTVWIRGPCSMIPSAGAGTAGTYASPIRRLSPRWNFLGMALSVVSRASRGGDRAQSCAGPPSSLELQGQLKELKWERSTNEHEGNTRSATFLPPSLLVLIMTTMGPPISSGTVSIMHSLRKPTSTGGAILRCRVPTHPNATATCAKCRAPTSPFRLFRYPPSALLDDSGGGIFSSLPHLTASDLHSLGRVQGWCVVKKKEGTEW